MTDMQSRLFWITIMSEAIMSDELSLPTSRLKELQEQVPFPRFVKFDDYSSVTIDDIDDEEDGDALFNHYYFLSQIAHRILLNRTKESLYFSCTDRNLSCIFGFSDTNSLKAPTGKYPPASLEDELLRQLEQWRNQLPSSLQFNDDDTIPPVTCPRDILVASWLRSRYLIAKIHMERPFLYGILFMKRVSQLTGDSHRVLSHPELRQDADLLRCKEVIESFITWSHVIKVMAKMKNCLPLKFNICTQYVYPQPSARVKRSTGFVRIIVLMVEVLDF
jgi:hypothetical protein